MKKQKAHCFMESPFNLRFSLNNFVANFVIMHNYHLLILLVPIMKKRSNQNLISTIYVFQFLDRTHQETYIFCKHFRLIRSASFDLGVKSRLRVRSLAIYILTLPRSILWMYIKIRKNNPPTIRTPYFKLINRHTQNLIYRLKI